MIALLSFIASPVGKVIMVAIALLGAVAFIDRRATYRERARCNAEKIQSQLDAKNADLEIARQAEAEAKRAAEALATEKQTAETQNEELKRQVAKLPVSQQCILPDRTKRVR